MKNDLWVRQDLSLTKLERCPGEVKALECHWASPNGLLYDHYWMYMGEVEEIEKEEESKSLYHHHRVQDRDREEYWNEILAYLHLNRLPVSQTEADKIWCQAQWFFIMNEALWCRNGNKPPLLVILNQDMWLRIVRNAHDDSGHRGRDPTYQKVRDSYWWPNQYISVATYCCSCHKCQMRSTYWNTIPLQPQYVLYYPSTFILMLIQFICLWERGVRNT